MAEKLWTLREAVEQGEIKQCDFVDVSVLQGGDVTKNRVTLTKEMTGFHKDQEFYGEHLTYQIACGLDFKGSISAVGSPTKQNAVFYSKKGYGNILTSLDLVMNLFSNNRENSSIRIMSIEDWERLKTTSIIRNIKEKYILASTCFDYDFDTEETRFCVYRCWWDLYGGSHHPVYNHHTLYSTNFNGHINLEFSINASIRPIFLISENTFCDFSDGRDGSSPENAVRLFFNE